MMSSSCDKALEIEPRNANAWNHNGLSLAELRLHQEAASSYDKALEIE
jgi:Flp pilus assembly protein TadD